MSVLSSSAAEANRVCPISALLWPLAHWDGQGALLALASGGLASGLGYAVWYAALRGLTATRAAVIQLAVPVIAALGGVALLGESVTLRLGACGAVILAGVGLALAAGRR